MYLKFNMAIKLRSLKGKTLLIAMLRRIELAKELFMLEVETGKEVFIPVELSEDHFPNSMRYYDPIMAIVQENISD